MNLVIKFNDKSSSFVNGYEAGLLAEKMNMGLSVVNNNGFPVHIKNMEVIKDICKYYNYIPIFGQTYFDEWIAFSAHKIINLQ